MEGPGRRGRRIDRSRRTVSGEYFDLACVLVGVSQEEVARRAEVASSTLSRGFSGQLRVKREKLLAWGDILFHLCTEEDRGLLLEMEAEMLHTLGLATRDDEERALERLPYYQERINTLLASRKHQE